MRIHVLKTWSPFFEATRDGKKPWEIREDDRNYQEGDYLVLRRFVPTGLQGAGIRGAVDRHPAGKWGNEYVVMKVVWLEKANTARLWPGCAVMTLADVDDGEFVAVMDRVVSENAGGIWSGVRGLGVR